MAPTKRTNANGNKVTTEFEPSNRYHYDVLLAKHGFEQFNTDQDAEYFGVWVNRERGLIFTYAEGDCATIECPDDEHFLAEIRSLSAFHPHVPSFATSIDVERGQATEHYAPRPHEREALDAAPAVDPQAGASDEPSMRP